MDAAGDRGDTTMNSSGALKVTAQSDREIVMTRVFDAPRNLVFDAYTKPDLLKRWLGVFGGYSMPVCEVDLRVGGTYRFVWRGPDGAEMGVRGVYREVVRPERLVHTEKFDEAWYPREAVIAVVKSPMESGVAQSYDKLAELFASGAREKVSTRSERA